MLQLPRFRAPLFAVGLLCAVAPACSSPAPPAATTVVVDPGVRYQTLEGWGTSLCWWAYVIGGYPARYRNDVMTRIFDRKRGLGLNVVRYNIGGGENPIYHFMQPRAAVPGYEPAPGVWDWKADANQRWVLRDAMRRGANRLEAFSNSPPYWMTISGSVTGAKGGTDNLDPAHAANFAQYLTAVVQHFHDVWGITYDTVEPLNEPSGNWWRFGGRQEGCHFDRASQDALIRVFGPVMAARAPYTGISAPDENSINGAVASIASYSDLARSYLVRINTHSYGGRQRAALHDEAVQYHKGLWMSEYGDGDATGMRMSHRILSDMKEMKPTAWVYWQAVDGGGWGLLARDNNDPTPTPYVVNEKYWVLANYSRFMRPGCQFISIDDPDSLASYDRRSHTLVIVTTGAAADRTVTFDLSRFHHLPRTVSAYRTSANEHLASLPALKLQGSQLVTPIPADSVTTFVVRRADLTPSGVRPPHGAIARRSPAFPAREGEPSSPRRRRH